MTIGASRFRLRVVRDGSHWLASAERAESGERFGETVAGSSEQEAVARLEQWLEWQDAHAAALDALQRAERAYHRTIASSAFASPVEGPPALELQKASLHEVEAARVRLDEIRARKPA
jgi:hypothetical protein